MAGCPICLKGIYGDTICARCVADDRARVPVPCQSSGCPETVIHEDQGSLCDSCLERLHERSQVECDSCGWPTLGRPDRRAVCSRCERGR